MTAVRSIVPALLSAFVLLACVDAREGRPTPDEQREQAQISSTRYLEDNTYDGVFHVPRPPSVQGEVNYADCSYLWGEIIWFGPIPIGTTWHLTTCTNGAGEYCMWAESFAGDPSEVEPDVEVCIPTACACVTNDDGGGGGCGCSGYCGSTCCI